MNQKQQEKINYADVIALGFVRENHNDKMFENQYGYNWFTVTKKLIKNISADWDCETRTVTIIRVDKDENILAKMPIVTFAELKSFIQFFDSAPKSSNSDIVNKAA